MLLKQLLRLLVISDIEKFVSVDKEIYSSSLKSTTQPFAAVETNLNMIREPCLQPYIHKSKFDVIKIKVQMFTLCLIIFKLGEPIF